MIDVLVIGLGPAGASAAAAAARAGARVVAVDRRVVAGVPVQCAELVPAPLACDVALAAVAAQPVVRMLTRLAGDAHETAPFPGWMIDRARFDAGLVDAAREAGAQCRFGVAVRAIAPDGAVTLSTGETVAPHAIVGADGPRSRAGRAIGAVNRDLVETRQVTVPLLRAHDATDIFLDPALRGGYAWLFPRGRVANLGVGAAPQPRRNLKPILALLHAQLVDEERVGRAILATTGGAIPVGGPVGGTDGPVGRLGATTVLLAGDAAGLANPVTGAGIAAAVMSGGLAGAAAASGRVAEYGDEIAALFGASLARAQRRRAEVLARYRDGVPDAAALRRAWIAYPEYWAA